MKESGQRAGCPLVGAVDAVRYRGAQLVFITKYQEWQVHHWCPVVLTDRFTLSRETDVKGSRACNAVGASLVSLYRDPKSPQC